jgi:mannuronan synthase
MLVQQAALSLRQSPEVSSQEKWPLAVRFHIAVYFAVCSIAVVALPNSVWSPDVHGCVYAIGSIALWRYLWWGNHWLRATIFAKVTYPRMRERAAALWESGWRPRHVHILMTTYKEHGEVSQAVVAGLVSDIRECSAPATIWLGTSLPEDEERIAECLKRFGGECNITLRIVRQNQPGKRMAIALVLRAISRAGLGDDDLIVFMDGDFVVHQGVMRRCFPLFALDPELHALTTDEDVEVRGPWWMQSWLDMRFAQRRLAMQSHALSNRVLTLTGRFSVFRARHVTSIGFIRLQEADYLRSWLWGTFRFLSGDDKSTWYALLKKGVKMTYVPDTCGTTIEIIEGSPYERSIESLRRWSGNMLRNGQRAIALGPWRMPFFIWWCLIDQRIAIWAALVGPMVAMIGTLKFGFAFLASYVIFVALTRMLVSMVLFTYARRVDLAYVWVLYVNQLMNAAIKVHMLWRLAKQKWANRGGQSQGMDQQGLVGVAREGMAVYLTWLSLMALILFVMISMGLLESPSWSFFVAGIFGRH